MANQEIIKQLKALKKIEPSLKWQALNRDFLLQQIKAEVQENRVKVGLSEYVKFFGSFFGKKIFEPAVAILLILGVFLGSSLVVNAAFYSLPGDSLYRLKIALEKTQLAITPNADQQVELKVEFARNRVEEFDKIVTQPNVSPEAKKEQINLAVTEFRNGMAAVRDHLDKQIKNQPAQSAENSTDKEKSLKMAITVSSKAEELAKEFSKKASNLSTEEKAVIKNIVDETVASAQQISLSAQELLNGTVKGEAVELDKTEDSTIEKIENNTASSTDDLGSK